MKNLFQLLKPEAKKNLVRNKIKYEYSTTKLINKLKTVYFVSDLQIDDVVRLYSLTDLPYPETIGSALFCTNIFDETKRDEK